MLDRRNFLKTGAAGLAGLGLAPGLPAAPPEKAPARPAPKVSRRTLGRTGLLLPPVSMGVMNADNPALVKAALEGGMVHFDTAHGYQRGRNEEMLGQVFKDVKRDAVVIATKVVWPAQDRAAGLLQEAPPEAFADLFHTSLKRLGTDHVDILYIHSIKRRDAALFEPMLKALQALKKAGKARFIGISTHQNEPEVIRAAVEAKVYDVVLTAYNFRKDNLADLERAMGEAARAGLGLVAMKTQAGVFFDKEKTRPINMKAALRWALQNEHVATCIPGFTTFEQLADDLAVMADPRLSPQEKAELAPPAPRTGGLYCQACGTCLPQCPARLPVPELMRGYMYASGYRNLLHAKDLVASLGVGAAPCGDCAACAVACPQGFDVRERVGEVLRLRDLDDRFLA